MMLAAGFSWGPDAVPSSSNAGLGQVVDATLVQFMFLNEDDVKALCAQMYNESFAPPTLTVMTFNMPGGCLPLLLVQGADECVSS